MYSALSQDQQTTITTIDGSRKFAVDTTTLVYRESSDKDDVLDITVGKSFTLTMEGRDLNAPELTCTDLQTDRAILNGGITLDDFLARELADPEVAAAAREVRKASGRAKQQTGIAKLRLTAGLTQAELATRMQTQQSAIARLEKNPSTMSYAGMVTMSEAIGCDLSELFTAIQKQCTPRSVDHEVQNVGI